MMEQESSDWLHQHDHERAVVLERIRQRWPTLPPQSAAQLQDWKEQGRP